MRVVFVQDDVCRRTKKRSSAAAARARESGGFARRNLRVRLLGIPEKRAQLQRAEKVRIRPARLAIPRYGQVMGSFSPRSPRNIDGRLETDASWFSQPTQLKVVCHPVQNVLVRETNAD